MRGRGGTVPLVCCGAVTAAALAFWVYYILTVYPAGGAGAAGMLGGEGEGRTLSPAVQLLGTRETALAALTGEL